MYVNQPIYQYKKKLNGLFERAAERLSTPLLEAQEELQGEEPQDPSPENHEIILFMTNLGPYLPDSTQVMPISPIYFMTSSAYTMPLPLNPD